MKRAGFYKNVKLFLLRLFTLCCLLSGQAAMAQKQGIIYYDYIDEHGVLKGGVIKVDPTNPKHTVVEGARADGLPEGAVVGVETIIDNGDPNNRVDLVILGDGYTEPNLGVYATDVNNLINRFFLIDGFFTESPFDEYASFFNVHRVDVKSNDSGVPNCPPADTPLEMCFGEPNNRGLQIHVQRAKEAAAYAPDCNHILALANSKKYGGQGYIDDDIATVTGHEELGWTKGIALHEFGHSFGNLGDEYWTDNRHYMGGEEQLPANLSIYEANDMNSQQRKWYRWLGEPTVPDVNRIGTYPGGGELYATGIYRPTDWSMMRRVDYPFYQVNAEQLILKIYELVNPIDYATPGGTYAIGTQFFVQPVKPAAHSLDVQWYLDGNPILGATGTEFDSSTLDLTAGQYTLDVNVVDNTEMVRDANERERLMTDSRTWTLGEAGHWKFDEGSEDTAYDSIGDIDGTLGADPCDPNWVNDPNRGWCLDFDGDDDYVSLSDMNALADNSTTIAAWIKAENLIETYYPIVSTYHNDGSDHGYLLYVKENPSSEYRPRFYIATGAGVVVESDSSIDEDVWYHIAGTFDGIKLKVYVNGELKTGYANGYTGYYEDYDTTYIGYEDNIPGEGSVYFDGEIDDVRVYDWAMDQAQIWEIMCTDMSKFIIKDNSSVLMAWVDDSGNLFLRGSLEQGGGEDPPSITYNDGFKFKNSSDANLAMVDAINGNMYIKGLLQPQWKDPCDVIDNFIIKDSSDNTVAYIDDPNGDLYLKGKLFDDPD